MSDFLPNTELSAELSLKEAKRRMASLKREIENLSSERFMRATQEINLTMGQPKNKITNTMITQYVKADKKIQALTEQYEKLSFDVKDLEDSVEDSFERIMVNVRNSSEAGFEEVSLAAWLAEFDASTATLTENVAEIITTLHKNSGDLDAEFWKDDVWENCVIYSHNVNEHSNSLRSVLLQLKSSEAGATKQIKHRLEALKGIKEDSKNLIDLAKSKLWTM